jgi:2-polyprenyl-3-methyl-5-hydroxy-6-metoxy-1,4-benzoquinol methylase
MIAPQVQHVGHGIRRTVARSSRRVRRALLGVLAPRYAQRRKRERWEQRWSRHDFAPGWSAGPIPDELRSAVETGWFKAGGAVLDVGCGDGRLAGWLADRGFEVVGLDFSETAIAKARASHGTTDDRLRFEIADVCSDGLGVQRFDSFVDRGTLQSVAGRSRRAYVRNLALAAKPGARFLVLHPTSVRQAGFRRHERTRAKLIRNVEELFAPAFEIERVTDAVFGDERDGEPFARGVAFWMVRRHASASA